MRSHQTMKLIMTTYPGFQALPKGVRKMLLVSESFFFDEMRQPTKRPAVPGADSGSVPPPVLLPSTALRQDMSPGT